MNSQSQISKEHGRLEIEKSIEQLAPGDLKQVAKLVSIIPAGRFGTIQKLKQIPVEQLNKAIQILLS